VSVIDVMGQRSQFFLLYNFFFSFLFLLTFHLNLIGGRNKYLPATLICLSVTLHFSNFYF
jgi:hypothetical protein